MKLRREGGTKYSILQVFMFGCTDGRAPEAVDAHAMALFLFAQLYIRLNQMQFTLDVWPASSAEGGSAAGEVTSPARRVPHNNSGAQMGEGGDTLHAQALTQTQAHTHIIQACTRPFDPAPVVYTESLQLPV